MRKPWPSNPYMRKCAREREAFFTAIPKTPVCKTPIMEIPGKLCHPYFVPRSDKTRSSQHTSTNNNDLRIPGPLGRLPAQGLRQRRGQEREERVPGLLNMCVYIYIYIYIDVCTCYNL